VIPRKARHVLLALAALCLGACATQPPITKLVNDRQIVTRPVNASAYEHASRAFLYEEEERWENAAAELQRALVFDDESPELQAHLAEIFMRLGRPSDAAAAIRASFKIEVTADGLMAEAHLREAQGDVAGAVQSLRQAAGKVDLADQPDTAETVSLELAEAQILALDVPAAAATLADLCRQEPGSLQGHMRLMAVAWALGDMKQSEAHLRQTLAVEPNTSRRSPRWRGFWLRRGATTMPGGPFAKPWTGRRGHGNRGSLRALSGEYRRQQGRGAVGRRQRLSFGRLGSRYSGREHRAGAFGAPAGPSSGPGEEAKEAGLSDDAKTRLALTAAALLKEQGHGDEAVATLLAVPKTSPLFFEAQVRAAELLRDDGKTSEAARAAESATAAAGENADQKIDAAIALAFVDEKRGDAIMATRKLEALRASHPDQAHLTLSLAMIEERRGAWQRALDLVEPLIKKKPGSVEALNFWGFVCRRP